MNSIRDNIDYLRNGILTDKQYTDDQLFNYLTIQYLCYKSPSIDDKLFDIRDIITDGTNDGGIDYVFYDDNENKVIIGQNKYSENIGINEFAAEIDKIINTLKNFENGATGKYNSTLKEKLQNALDDLTPETEGNIDIYFVSNSAFDKEKAYKRVEDLTDKINTIEIYNLSDFNQTIDKIHSTVATIEYQKVNLDEANNVLKYEDNNQKGIMVNISSKSVSNLYNKFHTKGLFNLNIRRYIKNKAVDDGIKDTLDKKREEFWFLNNGLTIACEEFTVDGNTLNLTNFSIVNGGQTTTLIGEYKGTNDQEFFIPCKVIQTKSNLNDEEKLRFFNKIAEATNSQKPIQPKDLKSNAPEMLALKNLLSRHNIFLEIKRGEQNSNKKYKIKNDDLAQIIFSFVGQKPGTARSAKKSLFSNNSHYATIFKQNYGKSTDKTEFLIDIVKLKNRYDIIEKKIKSNMEQEFDPIKASVFKHGKMLLFALFGVMYRVVNEDITLEDINQDPQQIQKLDFEYGKFISNYRKDDIDQKVKGLIKYLIEYITEEYSNQFDNNRVSSVSNFLKTDSKYINDILKKVVASSLRERNNKELKGYIEIFKRS